MRPQSPIKLFLCLFILVLSACSTINESNRSDEIMGDEKDGAPEVSVDLSHIKNPTPGPVVRTAAGNKSPYVVFGKRYKVLPDSAGFRQRGNASWYGKKFHGRRTSNGEIYNMYAMTAAHKTLPIPSYVKVTNLNNNRSVIVRVNDRGPFHSDRIIDLSYAAARKLGYAEIGTASVIVEDVTPKTGPIPKNTDVELTAIQSADGSAKAPSAVTIDNDKTAGNDKVKKTVGAWPTKPTPAYLQMGAFRERRTAEKLREKLTEAVNYPVAVALTDGPWYRVRIGPVDTVQSIDHLSDTLERRGYNKPLIVYD